MLNCRQVTRLVSQSLEVRLPWRQRLVVRIHLCYCVWCRRYSRQIRFLRRAGRHALAADLEAPPEVALPPEVKARLRERLREALKEPPPPS